MISPWEIYLVMQLDTITSAATLVSFLGATALIFMWVWIAEESEGFTARLIGAALTGMWGVCVVVAIFLPSSKTAAAMIVIPAIANNEQFRDEAGDLYRLAKQGLQKLVAEESDSKRDPE